MTRAEKNNGPPYGFSLLDSRVSVSDPARLPKFLAVRRSVSLFSKRGIDGIRHFRAFLNGRLPAPRTLIDGKSLLIHAVTDAINEGPWAHEVDRVQRDVLYGLREKIERHRKLQPVYDGGRDPSSNLLEITNR